MGAGKVALFSGSIGPKKVTCIGATKRLSRQPGTCVSKFAFSKISCTVVIKVDSEKRLNQEQSGFASPSYISDFLRTYEKRHLLFRSCELIMPSRTIHNVRVLRLWPSR